MRNLIIFVGVALSWCAIRAKNVTENQQNKTKRGVVEHTHYYGEPIQLKYIHSPIYSDSNSAAASSPTSNYYTNNPRSAPIFQKPPVETEVPKQVTVQQVLYEYQQTPHNAVSNVHVNQQFQTAPGPITIPVSDTVHSPTAFVNQPQILQVEPNQHSNVATPVHHGTVIHHGQGYSKLLYPFPVAQTTASPLTQNHNHNHAPAKYIYANGKILYHPAAIAPPARSHLQLNPPYQQRPLPAITQKPFRPSPLIPPTHARYQAPNKPITKPSEAPVKEEVDDDDTDGKSDVKEEDEESEFEEQSNYEEEDDDSEGFKPSYYSGKYRHEEEDDEDHGRYREHEDDEDEDNTRSYSRNVRKKPKKSSGKKPSNKYHKNDHYKYKEGYKTNKKFSEEYKTPNEYYKFDSSNKKPKTHYKSYKYYKAASNPKPKKEAIEGRQSQNVPIVHKQNSFHQEKWIVTKNDTE